MVWRLLWGRLYFRSFSDAFRWPLTDHCQLLTVNYIKAGAFGDPE